tara:strand:+ start:182 stop:355 length:174 start_codon:yes stop_codon:yes gene_type:complete
MDNDVIHNFFIIEEKDGSHSAILKFANFINKKEAQQLIDDICEELGYIKTTLVYTIH